MRCSLPLLCHSRTKHSLRALHVVTSIDRLVVPNLSTPVLLQCGPSGERLYANEQQGVHDQSWDGHEQQKRNGIQNVFRCEEKPPKETSPSSFPNCALVFKVQEKEGQNSDCDDRGDGEEEEGALEGEAEGRHSDVNVQVVWEPKEVYEGNAQLGSITLDQNGL
mmetsp:Transcript_9506/g.15558  ORF Transcript_9506/g.15558 Transcript_9506/m.15558 type:complete len:164 (-) Transcript_9506:1867-2358(-)